jgi:hypothetical protein
MKLKATQKLLLLLILLLPLSGCKTFDEIFPEHWPVFYEHTVDSGNAYSRHYVGRHNLAGTRSGWDNNARSPGGNYIYHTYGILSDIKIGNLQIRHVRKLWQHINNFSRPINRCKTGNLDFLELNGEINKDSVVIVERLLKGITPCRDIDTGKLLPTRVYMNSNGGRLLDGYKLGELFKKYNAETVVAGGQFCASSCAVAFLGGKYRIIEPKGIILFHTPYIESENSTIKCSSRSKSNTLKEYYINMTNKRDGDILFDRTMDYCDKTGGWEINGGAAKVFGLTTQYCSNCKAFTPVDVN